MARSIVFQSFAYAIVGLFLFGGFAGAQNTAIPEVPLQDLTAGTILECRTALERPVSLTDTGGITGPGVLRPDDIDRDGKSNQDEVSAGSDPTWARSTPNDRDGDGFINANGARTGPVDPCDLDPSVPVAHVLLTVTCTTCGSDPITRRDVLLISVQLRDGNDVLVDATNNQTVATIDMDQDGTPDETITITEGVGYQTGYYNATYTILIGDHAGDWTIDAEAQLGGATRAADPVTVTVAPTTFAIALQTRAINTYFDGDFIPVNATPEEENSFDAPQGEARLHVESDGIPLTEDKLNGDAMQWDGTHWHIDFPTDAVGEEFDGTWTIYVTAHDNAPGANNTGRSGDRSVIIGSDPIHDLELSAEEDLARRGTIHYVLNYTGYGVPVQGANITITGTVDGTALFTDARMNSSATVGQYTFNYTTSIGTPSGSVDAIATLLGADTSDSNEFSTTVNPLPVALTVTTDKASYLGPGAPGLPSAGASAPWTQGVVDALTGPTPANVVGALPASPGASVDASVSWQGDKVVVIAFPAGVEGVDYFNDAVGTPPGTAKVDLVFAGAVPAIPTDVTIVEGRTMTFAPAGADGIPVAHYNYTYATKHADPAGTWTAEVSFADDAVDPNEGSGSATFQIKSGTNPPLPPTVTIDTVNGDPITSARMDLDVERWDVHGTYTERHDPAEATDVTHVWVRIKGATVTTWLPAQLSEGAAGAGEWDIVLHAQTFYNLAASSDLDIQAVAVVDPILSSAQCAAPLLPMVVPTIGPVAGQTVAPTAGPTIPAAGGQTLATAPTPVVVPKVSSTTIPPGGQTVGPTPPAAAAAAIAAACRSFTPNGPIGGAIVDAPTLPTGGPVLYSLTETTPVHLTFPDTPVSQILGVLGPDGSLKGIGDVLWNGTAHVISGKVALNGTLPKSVKAHIERVAWDNCAPEEQGEAGHDDWCLRDRVTRYTVGGQEIDGFDFFKAPVAGRMVTNSTAGNTYEFNWTWNINDSKQYVGQTNCGDDKDGSYYLETNANLTRRTNVHHNSTARFEFNGGDASCHDTPERLENQTYLQPWQKSAMTDSAIGARPHIEGARYWIWLDYQTTKGFYFNQTKPPTSDDIRLAGGDDNAQETATSPAPAGITSAGDLPGYTAKQIRFGGYPIGNITGISSVSAQGDVVSAPKGDDLFRLRSPTAPLTITGTVDNNGNEVDGNALQLVLYNVKLEDCINDVTNDGSESDGFDVDHDAEWCQQGAPVVLPLRSIDFATGYSGDALEPVRSFTKVWTPIPSASGVWFAAVSIATADGDRVESIAPLVKATTNSKDPNGGLFDGGSFHYAAGFEDHCAAACPATVASSPEPAPAAALIRPGYFVGGMTGAMIIEEQPVLNVTSLGPFKPLRIEDPYGAHGSDCVWSNTGATQCTPSPIVNKFASGFTGSVTGDELILLGNATDFGFKNDLVSLTVRFQAKGYVAPAATTVFQTVSETFAFVGDTLPEGVTPVTTTFEGHAYMERTDLEIHVNTSSYMETWGANVEATRKNTAALGAMKDYLRGEIIVTLTSASGFVRTLPTINVQVDRLTAPDTALQNATITTVNGTFESNAASVPGSVLQRVVDGQVIPNTYDVSGDAVLRFRTHHAGGVDLGSNVANLGKLTGVDVATSVASAMLEFYTTKSDGTGVLDAAGLPGSHTVTFDTPIKICPGKPTTPDDPACDYSGTKTIQAGGATEVQGFTVFYLLPLRAGIDPPFVVIDDPADPSTWGVNTGDTYFGADLQAQGVIVDQAGRGPFMDSNKGDGYIGIEYLDYALSGDLDPSKPNAALQAEAQLRKPGLQGGTDPQVVPPNGWFNAGIDERCAGYVQAVSGGHTPAPEDRAECVYDPYLPISPKADDPSCTGNPPGTPPPAPPTAAPLSNCFEAHEGDDWGQCLISDPRMTGSDACPAAANRPDEDQIEAFYLLNRNLPIWIRSSNFPPAHGTVGVGKDWQPPSEPDPNEPEPTDGDFSIPRGFVWDEPARRTSADFATTGADNVTFDFRTFEHVFQTLDRSSPDFGKLIVPDGDYTISVRGTDNLESWSSVIDPETTANDAPRIQEIVLHVENDRDDDGISDIREDWLHARIQGRPYLLDMCADLTYSDCTSDRYRNTTSTFPDADVKASTETDWDGDGIDNLLQRSTPAIPNPVTGGVLVPSVTLPAIDLETTLFNSDPLVPDMPGVPSPGACPKSPGAFGAGPFGDRDLDCVPNISDSDKGIYRCTDASSTVNDNPDNDGDGYCLQAEAAAGSSDDNATQTPKDIDGDRIPNDVDDRTSLVDEVISIGGQAIGCQEGEALGGCADRQGASALGCPSGETVSDCATRQVLAALGCTTGEALDACAARRVVTALGCDAAMDPNKCIAFKAGCATGEDVQTCANRKGRDQVSALPLAGGPCAATETPQACLQRKITATANDFDGDGATNSEELNASPRSNPFYKHSTPTNKGAGFPSDWDADGFINDFELRTQPATNPFQRCSNPNDGPRGWSTANPRVSCEDTNPVGGVNA